MDGRNRIHANEPIFEWDGKETLPKELTQQNIDYDRMKNVVGYMADAFQSKVELIQKGTVPMDARRNTCHRICSSVRLRQSP